MREAVRAARVPVSDTLLNSIAQAAGGDLAAAMVQLHLCAGLYAKELPAREQPPSRARWGRGRHGPSTAETKLASFRNGVRPDAMQRD